MEAAYKTVFISYSRSDRRWLELLKGRLNSLLVGKDVDLWDDSLIKPGQAWEQEIFTVINRACAAILLVSPRFLASDFITKNELPAFIEAANDRGMLVLWVPIRASKYDGTWLSSYQWVHSPSKPIAGLRGNARTRALDKIIREIADAIETQPALPFHRDLVGGAAPPFRIFRQLRPGLFDPADLAALAIEMEDAGNSGRVPDPEYDESEENIGVPAGYSFLGSLIHDDSTFRQIGSATAEGEPGSSFGGYAPAFNLHTIYGFGPNIQPYFYRRVGRGIGDGRDRLKMNLGDFLGGSVADPAARDLPRVSNEDGESVALVPDARTEDSIIKAQLHSMMLRFHNRLIDIREDASFHEVRQAVRFHFQWIVIHDFLRRFVQDDVLYAVLPHLEKGTNPAQDPPQLRFFRPDQGTGMPIEYELAVVRFGHSTVRQTFKLNQNTPPIPFFSLTPTQQAGLQGGRACPPGWAIDWKLFFEMRTEPQSRMHGPPQYSAKIDTAVPSTVAMHIPATSRKGFSLAYRNLLRGLRAGIPCGQAVSKFMNCTPIPDDSLTVGRATERDSPTNKRIIDISPRFRNNAPLWYYVLAEAQQQFVDDRTPTRLGPLAGRIFAEVLVGLMWANRASYLRSEPSFQPYPELCSTSGQFSMADLLRAGMQA
jgi:hypothetical protein